ncbi:hypothetical protein ACFSC6_16655 [Rufibacter sediminis]|uniref:Uncharacterized protein n=1 Tax=Rufibacter sediminis TaxID=2762756 RepID=A0ABR6VMF3_9BACT|nr:hypothetical protein [Rufibacter sediminis]MBC3538381.1 hypothetical protein [Rufibacter sediminis]
MLHLLGFIYLDFAGRADYLMTHGRYLTSRTEGEFEVQLYWTPNFFAEVYFSPARHRNEKISAITEKPTFDEYLAYISLPQLLSQ